MTLAEGAHGSGDRLGAVVQEAPIVQPPPDDGGDGRRLRRTLGFAAGGVGVVGIGVAVGTGLALESKKSELDKHCPNKQCDLTG